MELETLLRNNIKKLKPYASARHEFTGDARIFLDANENPFDSGLNRYPDPLATPLRQRLAELKGVRPDHVFTANGSDEAIDLLLRLFCEPRKDAIITLPPTYGMYEVSAGIADVEVVHVPLQTNFELDLPAILAATQQHRACLLFLCRPNNPTGNLFAERQVRTLLEQFEGIVVIDEAYIDFCPSASLLPWIDAYPNLVVLQTLSKAWGLAGIRLGMAFAQAPLIRWLDAVKPPYNVNQLTQKVALEALQQPEQVEQVVEVLVGERQRLAQALTELPFVEKVFPSQANFLLVRMRAARKIYEALAARGIVVRDRSRQPLCAECLRISVGTPEQNDVLLKALRQIEVVENR